MTIDMDNEITWLWVFNGANSTFPSAVFSSEQKAEAWIKEHKLSGTLTAYPLDLPVYDWAINKGYFKPKKAADKSARFIQTFSSAYQEHCHYEDGE